MRLFVVFLALKPGNYEVWGQDIELRAPRDLTWLNRHRVPISIARPEARLVIGGWRATIASLSVTCCCPRR